MPQSGRSITRSGERAWRQVGIGAVLLFGVARAWIGRASLSADGISYLDMSDGFGRHDWRAFLNGCWSPLYPFLLGICRQLFPSSKPWDLMGAHVVNFMVYAAALGCFEFFYSGLRESRTAGETAPGDSAAVPVPEWALWLLAHALFLWVSLDLITIWSVGPDLCVSAFVYASAGLILRYQLHRDWRVAVALGAVLGASYWAKAVMFPLAFAFMAIALFSASNIQVAVRHGLMMATIFAVVAGPLVAALSIQKHRFTFGDSGRINYAMYVSPGGVTRNWQGEPALGIKAVHPTRKLLSDPAVYEFAEPIGGTFPPWYDPSYWEEGRVARFSLKTQIIIVVRHLLSYMELVLHQENALLAGFLTLFLLGGRSALRAIRENWVLLLMCAAALGLYMLVHVENRYIGPYVALLWLALFSRLRVPDNLVRVSGRLLLAVAGTLLVTVADNTVRAVRDGGRYSARTSVLLSGRLDDAGLHPGDRIAIVDGGGMYAARLSRVKIVAEIMGEDTPVFWGLTPEKRDTVFRTMAGSGARMVLAPDPGPAVRVGPLWIKLEGLPYYLHWL